MGREMPHETSVFEDEYKCPCMLHTNGHLKLETDPLNLSAF